MRLSRYFFKTIKEAPSDADTISHQLLERGGYLQKVGRGVYVYTPLLLRVLKKISSIIRHHLDAIGCQELQLPYLQPKELWDRTGRWDDYTQEKLLYTLEDRHTHAFCLAPTCEEMIVDTVAQWIDSYKKLPLTLYQINSKFRDEIRPRFGLIRAKEFLMHDAYSFGATSHDMEHAYEQLRAAYARIFDTLDLNYVIVRAHSGKIGKGCSEEFQVLAEIGEDSLFFAGDLSFNQEYAKAIPPSYPSPSPTPLQEVHTPQISTIEALSAFLKVPHHHILKTVVLQLLFSDHTQPIAIGIRGDRQVNLLKVRDYFDAMEVIPYEEPPNKGFIGPMGLEIPFYADHSCATMAYFVCGANKPDYHFQGVCWSDCGTPTYHDFLLAEAGDLCPENNQPYHTMKGIEVGHVFQLGTLYTSKMQAYFQNEEGSHAPFWMGTYGIGVGRAAQAIVEQHHDEHGILWPFTVAPFHLTIIPGTEEAHMKEGERLYQALLNTVFEPLLDDRKERIGLKLKESDLIGIPYKVIIGRSFLNEGSYEIETRTGEKHYIPSTDFISWLTSRESSCTDPTISL